MRSWAEISAEDGRPRKLSDRTDCLLSPIPLVTVAMPVKHSIHTQHVDYLQR